MPPKYDDKHVVVSTEDSDEEDEKPAQDEKKGEEETLPMLLWDKPPENLEDNADYAALQSLIYEETTPEERAANFKEQGNEALKTAMATEKKKYFLREAIKCYDQALEQKCKDGTLNAQVHSNKAHVNLLLGNYSKAFTDAKAAIKEDDTNVKAYYRGARSAMFLDKYGDAEGLCSKGLALDPENGEMAKILRAAEEKRRRKEEKDAEDERRRQADRAPYVALAREVIKRGIVMGDCLYNMPGGARRPSVDKEGVMHWPMLLLYGESSQSDFVEDFRECDPFSGHLDVMYGDDAPPLDWDTQGAYTRGRVELYFRRWAVGALPDEGVVDMLCEDRGMGGAPPDPSPNPNSSKAKWVPVKEEQTLGEVLRAEGHVLPGLPVFYVVAKDTQFRKDFRSGAWDPNSN